MVQLKISMIAAIGKNRELGKNNRLLWDIPEDLKAFKEKTMGHPVIMGRKTFESLGKPLEGRLNIIVTRDANYKAEGCIIAHSVVEAISKAESKDQQEIFVIGGGEIYHQAIKFVDRLYLTVVDGEFDADTFFPDYSEFKKVISEKQGVSVKGLKYRMLELARH